MSRTTCRGANGSSIRTRHTGPPAIGARKRERNARPGCEAATLDHPDQPGALAERRAKTADPRGHGRGVYTDAVPEIRRSRETRDASWRK
jgi:hypothetical protein